MLILCFLMLAALTGITGYGVYQNVATNKRLDRYTEAFNDYFEASPGEPSPFLQTINSVTDVIAQKQGISTQAAIRGALGGQQKAINAGLEEVAYQEAPELAIGELLPASLKKNNAAMFGLQVLMSKLMNNRSTAGTRPTPSNGSSSPQVRFDF